MTDSEKLDLLLEKVIGLEKDMIDVKADLRRLHRDDTLKLDEVERVHEILSTHIKGQTLIQTWRQSTIPPDTGSFATLILNVCFTFPPPISERQDVMPFTIRRFGGCFDGVFFRKIF